VNPWFLLFENPCYKVYGSQINSYKYRFLGLLIIEVESMKKQCALKVITGFAVAGVLFSGYLSYNELFGACTAGCSASGGIFGLPACVYGLVMYACVLGFAIAGLVAKK